MPIYEYQCAACGHRLDHLQRLADPDPLECPACAAAALKRRVSAPSFRLAGSGWYETDFKSDKDRRRNLVDTGSGEAKSEKPDAPAKAPDSRTPDSNASASTSKPAVSSE